MEEDPEPQTKPLTYDMVSNSADGYSYAVNDETRFLRYLCLETEGRRIVSLANVILKTTDL
jgi:hypothetical protein